MGNPYDARCDRFYVNTQLAWQLPHNPRCEATLHFFETIRKVFPRLSQLETDEKSVHLRDTKLLNPRRWIVLEHERLCCGCIDSPNLAQTLTLPQRLLETALVHLSISPLEIQSLELKFGFDLGCSGNQDEVVAECFFSGSPLASLLELDGTQAADIQPKVTVYLSKDCLLTATVIIGTQTTSQEVAAAEYEDGAVNVSLVVRQMLNGRLPSPAEDKLKALLAEMGKLADQLCSEHVVPKIVNPLSVTIASRS